MDIGDATFTNYDYDVNVAKLMMDRPGLFDCKIGHIHSHHSMDVFFSPTDQDELKVNSAYHNFYLSVIVNNPGDVVGKIVFRATDVKESSHKISFRDERGQWSETVIDEDVRSKDIFCFHECCIIAPDRELEPLFKERLNEIQKNSPNYRGTGQEVYPKGNKTIVPNENLIQNTLFPNYDLAESHFHFTVEEFISTLILQDLNPKVAVSTALEKVKTTSDIELLGNYIVGNAIAHYEHCFPNDPQLLAFTATMNECVEILSELSSFHLVAEVLMPYFDLELVN